MTWLFGLALIALCVAVGVVLIQRLIILDLMDVIAAQEKAIQRSAIKGEMASRREGH